MSTAGSPSSTVPPGTEGTVTDLVVGVIGLLAAAGLIFAATRVETGGGGWTFLLLVGTVAGLGGLFVFNAGIQRLRARRLAIRTGPHDWAGVCVQSTNHFLLRLLVVNADGVHLYTLPGRRMTTWLWPTVAKATGIPVEIMARDRPGLTLDTRDGSRPGRFAFPSPTGLGYSQGSADGAIAAVRGRLGKG